MPSLRHLRTFSEQPVSSAKAGQASARFALCTRRRMDALRHRGVRCRAPKPVTHAAGRVPCCAPATFHTTAFAMPPSAVSTPQKGPAYSLLSDAATIDRCHRPKREAKLQLSVRGVLHGKRRRFKSRQGRNVSHVMYEFLHRLCNYITLRVRVLHYVAPSLPTTLPCAHHTLCSYLVVAHVVLRARHEILVSIHLLPH